MNDDRNLFLSQSGGWKVKMKVLADLVSLVKGVKDRHVQSCASHIGFGAHRQRLLEIIFDLEICSLALYPLRD